MSLIPSANSLTGFKTRKIFEGEREVEIDYIEKDPNAIMDFSVDWYDAGNGWLGSRLISTSAWTIGSDLTDDAHPTPIDAADRVASILLSGGTARTWEDYGNWVKVSNRIVTDGSPALTNDRTFYVWIREL